MKKIKYLMCAVLVCLITLFACIPKASAYDKYVSDVDLEQVLYRNNHKIITEITLENGYTNFLSNLTLHYSYELIEDVTYLYIFMYEFDIYGGQTPQSIQETCQWYVNLNQDVFNEIGTEHNDSRLIDEQFEMLTRSTIKMSLYFDVEGNTITPIISFTDYDYITDSEFEMVSFDRVQPMYTSVLVNGIELDFVHTDLLNQTYLYNAYRNDGNSLSKIDDVSITDWLVNSVGGLFDTPILGGISIGDILMFILAIGLLFLFLRFFAGG